MGSRGQVPSMSTPAGHDLTPTLFSSTYANTCSAILSNDISNPPCPCTRVLWYPPWISIALASVPVYLGQPVTGWHIHRVARSTLLVHSWPTRGKVPTDR